MGLALTAAKAAITGTCYETLETYPTVLPKDPQVAKTSPKGLLKGRIIHDDRTKTGEFIPCIDQEIVVYANKFFGREDLVGRTRTDKDGNFKIEYDRNTWIFQGDKKFTIELVEKARPFSKMNLEADSECVLQSFQLSVPKVAHVAEVKLEASYAHQSRDFAVIRRPATTHWQSFHWFWKLMKASIPELLKAAFVALFGRWLNASQVQKIYDSFGPSIPKVAPTADNLIDSLLNGICSVGYTKVKNDYVWEANWDRCEFERNDALPNIAVKAFLNAAGKLKIDRIEIQYRGDQKPEVISSSDDRGFKRALYIAFSVFSLKGEAERRVAEGHLLPMMIAIPFFKFINKENPLFKILSGHFDEVHFASWLESKMSWLAPKGIGDTIVEAVNEKSDWQMPAEKPLNSQDKFASAKEFHTNLLYNYYKKYLIDNKAEIAKRWNEVYNWSQAIRERMLNCPSITQVTQNPTDADIDNLAHFMAFAVTKVTFINWVMQTRQNPLADIHTVGLGMKGRCKDANGNFVEAGNVSAADASEQLLKVRTQLNFETPSLVQNVFKGNPEDLIKLFKENASKYEGFPDILTMFGSTSL